MPRFVHPVTDHAIETAIPREAAELRAQGYREQKPRTAAVREADKQAEKPAPKS